MWRKSGYVQLDRPHDGNARRWLSIEGPFLAVYKSPEECAARVKPKAVVALSSFTIHKSEVHAVCMCRTQHVSLDVTHGGCVASQNPLEVTLRFTEHDPWVIQVRYSMNMGVRAFSVRVKKRSSILFLVP